MEGPQRATEAVRWLLRFFTILFTVALNACGGGDGGSPTDQDPATGVSSSGGSVSSADGNTSLEIPAGALSQTTEIKATPVASPPPDPGLVAGSAVQLEPSGTTFAVPVELSIKVSASALPAGAPPASLAIHRRTGNEWVRVAGSTYNVQQGEVTAPLNSFSVYAVIFIGAPNDAIVGGNTQSAQVGQPVSIPPSVIVLSSRGIPMPGLSVLFGVTGGGGTITGGAQITDEQGRAAVGSWTLGATPGTNTLQAQIEGMASPVVFTAQGTAPPPAAITKVAGDNQSAVTGTTVAVPPRVRVATATGAAAPGVSVTFTAQNGGNVTPSQVTTDASGEAAVTSWVLGSVGANTLTATVQGVATSAVFAATASPAGDPCTNPTPIALGQTINGTLVADVDCLLSPGRLSDRYTITFAQQQAFNVSLTTAAFGPLTGASREGGTTLVTASSSSPGTVSRELVLPPGTYWPFATSLATSATTPPTGAYSITVSSVAEPHSGCQPNPTFVLSGVSVSGNVTSTDCVDGVAPDAGTVTRRYDQYSIPVAAGQTATVTVTGQFNYQFSRWLGGAHQEVMTNVPAGASRTYIVNQTGTHTFVILAHTHQGGGAYTMTFSIAP